MADHLTLERFSVGTAQDWENWLEDYCAYGQLKKWNTEKLIANLRFFVSGEVKDCVRQVCAVSPSATLETIATEVSTLLGGTPDPLIAIHRLDSVCYSGNVVQTLLAIGELIPLAYPTITDKVHKDQMTWIHLQKLLPVQYQRDLIKAGINQLETAVERIRAFERADTVVRPPPLAAASGVIPGPERHSRRRPSAAGADEAGCHLLCLRSVESRTEYLSVPERHMRAM